MEDYVGDVDWALALLSEFLLKLEKSVFDLILHLQRQLALLADQLRVIGWLVNVGVYELR